MQTPFEPWLLTAYLLGELDLEQSELVRQELIKNPALQTELQELQQAITKVKLVMNRATDSQTIEQLSLNPVQSEIVSEQIMNVGSSEASSLASNVTLSPVVSFRRRQAWTVLAGLAATGLIAAFILPTRWLSKVTDTSELSIAQYLDDDVVLLPNLSKRIAQASEAKGTDQFQSAAQSQSPAQSQKTSQLQSTASSSSPGTVIPAKSMESLIVINESTVMESEQVPIVGGGGKGGGKGGGMGGGMGTGGYGYGAVPARDRTGGMGEAKNATQSYDRAPTQFYSQLDSLSAKGLQDSESAKQPMSGSVSAYNPLITTLESREVRASISLGLESQISLSKANEDRFESVQESNFLSTQESPLSTFSIDVDTASYSKIRQSLLQASSLPPANSVRIEEMLNYFNYDYAGPVDSHPFASNMVVGDCPWNNAHKLVRIGLQAKKIEVKDRPKANLVFLLDVSGSMDEPNKLPLVKQSIAMLVRQLGENDRISMVVYAGAAGCVLPSTTADKQKQILHALDELNAGGSTNGGQGIELAYSIAKEHFIAGGINRVILCTDGDFNVGTTSDEALVKLVEEQAKSKVFLTCLGFGAGNYNDSMMEKISNHGNGIYAMIDNALEGRRVMIEQLAGSLMTVAKDVKIQIEFNPSRIASYRLIGYDNRRLANQDFNDDKKDAGEIGAGHRVTALYEVVLMNESTPATESLDDLRYRRKSTVPVEKPAATEPIVASKPESSESLEYLTLKLRYKQPEGDVSSKVEFHLDDAAATKGTEDRDFQWAAAIAEFGLLLRGSAYAPQASWTNVLNNAKSLTGDDPYRIECLEMMGKAQSMAERK